MNICFEIANGPLEEGAALEMTALKGHVAGLKDAKKLASFIGAFVSRHVTLREIKGVFPVRLGFG